MQGCRLINACAVGRYRVPLGIWRSALRGRFTPKRSGSWTLWPTPPPGRRTTPPRATRDRSLHVSILTRQRPPHVGGNGQQHPARHRPTVAQGRLRHGAMQWGIVTSTSFRPFHVRQLDTNASKRGQEALVATICHPSPQSSRQSLDRGCHPRSISLGMSAMVKSEVGWYRKDPFEST